ncbi:hypothetical protein AQUCO_04200039v1 [Aquilegia coerulea]|uniref:FHA domain-containing protein n=1 Tax=Aquilegia coerulea TaxID=218851 RepID=A0A2G5CQA1_AQUCA|nr:hypothetical protein AQUCO_04200039v1 [Aquilegia coerulea]
MTWIPEDDLKLKNAVQAGASLEALAKGAIRFSHRYTIQELQNRWHALLYDPDTSVLASTHMVELELSSKSNNGSSDFKENLTLGKRKDESVRSHYYDARKRFRSICSGESPIYNCTTGIEGGCEEQVRMSDEYPMGTCMNGDTLGEDRFNHHDTGFDNMDENVPYIMDNEAIESNRAHSFDDDDMHEIMNALDENMDFLETDLGVQEAGPPQVLPFETANLTTEPFCELDLVNNNPVITHSGVGHSVGQLVCPVDDATQVSSSGYNVVHSDCHLEEVMFDDGLTNSRAISEGDFLDPSYSLLNFINEMDDDGKEMPDYFDLSSLLHSSPNDVHQDDMPSFTEHRACAAMDACLTIEDIACSEELNVIGGKLQSGIMTCGSDNSVPSSTLALDPHPEYRNGVICCTLNTEDPDIPCIDDVSPGLQHNTEEDGSRMTSEHGPQIFPEIRSIDPICDAASGPIGIVGVEPSQCGPAQFTPYSISPGELKEDAANVEQGKLIDSLLERSSEHNENHPQNIINDYIQEPALPWATQYYMTEDHGSDMLLSEPAENPPLSDQEEQSFEDDNEIPLFPDIEALILGMDLGSFDHDSCISMDVSRYQHEQAKRKILKLEQSAHSYTQRAIASHRAFAVFYGRRLKHYIKKPEVTLGRVTEDVSVDIDLAEEGHANKISRRQAIIKMGEDGSFSLKNLGKGLILVNGKEVANGNCMKLGPSCLIELRSMNFIFESNQKVVKQYLVDSAKNNQTSV